MYFYDESASTRAKTLNYSKRGELEISNLNINYLDEGKLTVLKMPRGTAWLDLGTPDSLLEAAKFIQIIEKRQGLEIGNPIQVAEVMGYFK